MGKSKKNVNTILAGDIHLLKKPGMWQSRAEIAGDDVYALEQIVSLCTDNDADLILLGDVFDSVTNLPRPIAAASQALSPLLSSGKSVKFIQGQHEMVVQSHYEQYPWLSLVQGTEHIGGKSFSFNGLKAYGLDYFPYAFEALALSKVPQDVEILFMHGTVDIALPMSFHFKAESLAKFRDLKLVLAGDWHKPDEYSLNGVPLYYSGSAWQLSSDEPRNKSVLLLKQTADSLEVSRLPLKTRKIIKLSEMYETGELSLSSLSDIDQALPKELRMPVILVDMPSPPELYEQLAQHAHLYTTSAANPDVPVRDALDKADLMSNEEILSNYVDRANNPDQFAFTLDVIDSPVDQAIKRLKDKFGIKDVDHTVQSECTDVNLDSDNEEEEVIA